MNETMTILLYDSYELEERASKSLRIWKAWHTILYILAAICGILNYTFLQSSMQLIENHCILYPRQLEFHWVALSDLQGNNDGQNKTVLTNNSIETVTNLPKDAQNVAVHTVGSDVEKAEIIGTVKRDVPNNETEGVVTNGNDTIIAEESNATVITENATHRLMLHTSRSLFATESDCQFAEYMPIMSTVFATVWATFFIMCPKGGRTRTGLKQPWRILTPALLFAIVMVGLTAHSFTSTNGGLHDFCAAFRNVTNSTTCSSVNPFLENGWNATWGIGGRAAATKAAAAGVWASWACAAALLLARCLAAPDFAVRRTAAYLKDPQQKIIPHLRRSPRRAHRSANSSPSKKDTVSVKSEPTITTELVTASVEHGPESEPSSLTSTPVRRGAREDIEMDDMQSSRIR